MITKRLFTALVLLTVVNVACEKARTPGRPARGGIYSKGSGVPGKPQAANLHKPNECPPDLNGSYLLSGSNETLSVTNSDGIRLTFKDEVVPSAIDGKVYFSDKNAAGEKQTYVGYCADQKLFYSIESGAELGKPSRKAEIEIHTGGTTALTVKVKASKIGDNHAFTDVQSTEWSLDPHPNAQRVITKRRRMAAIKIYE